MRLSLLQKLFVTVVILLVVTVLGLFSLFHSLGVGSYSLTVYIHCADQLPKKVLCLTTSRKEWVNRFDDQPPVLERFHEVNDDSILEKNFDGQPIKMQLKFTDDVSFFGLRRTCHHDQFLIVCAEWSNGRRVLKVVEIPNMLN